MKDSIICGDCLNVLQDVPDASIDITVFSPPYDAIRDYKGCPPVNLSAIGKELYRVSKDGAMVCVVMGDGTKDFAKSLTSFRMAVDWCDNFGFRLFECCVYIRHGKPGAWWSRRFRVDHEYIFMFLKGKRPAYFNKAHMLMPCKHAGKQYSGTERMTNGDTKRLHKGIVADMKCRGTAWRYSASTTEGNKIKRKHPATYPDALACDLIRCFSAEGAVVLDPMCGSGTTCVMAKKSGRHFIGIDIAQEYCGVAEQRIKLECAQESLL